MRSWFRNISFLLFIGCELQILGLLSGDLYKLLSLLSFLMFISTFSLGIQTLRNVRLPPAVAALFLILAGAILASTAPLGSYYLYLLVAASIFVLLSGHNTLEDSNFGSYIVALAGVGLAAESLRIFPLLWHLKMGIASTLSQLAEVLALEERNLGPTAMGLPLLGSLMVLALVRGTMAANRKAFRGLAILIALGLVHLFYLVILKLYARWIANYHPHWEWLILNSQHLFIFLGATAFTLIDRNRQMRPIELIKSSRTLWTSLAALAAGVTVVISAGWAAPPEPESGRVMIYDAGYVNWQIPVHGKYGERSAGMFGMLPSALEAVGFDVVVSDDLTLLEQNDPPEYLVMINIQKYIEDEDKKRIWNYIEKGGGLLCMGDHTGVAGIRGPFNDLLEPVGIRFRFDSSTFFGNGWNDALEFRNHPLNRGAISAEDFQIWVGATLDLDIKARPVIVARYGYSDLGNHANIQRSYLGDRRYNPNELLGDIALVADAHYGDGKVLVFGDTSGYQNLSLARTLDSVARSLHFLAGEEDEGSGVAIQLAWIFLIMLVLAGAIISSKSTLPVIACAVGLGAGSAAVTAASPPPAQLIPRFIETSPEFPFTPTPHVKRDLAILDFSHGGRFTLHAWREKSIGGLQLNLARNGYFPVIREKFPYEHLSEAKLLLLLSPARGYDRREIAAIEKFMVHGGHVIVSVGFEEFDGSKDLLAHFGISIANIPMGRFVVEIEADTLQMEFHEGWPVHIDAGIPAEILLSKWDQPLIVRRSIGKGELLVIGDSSFFHDVNLESREQYLAGNVAFLRQLTERWGQP